MAAPDPRAAVTRTSWLAVVTTLLVTLVVLGPLLLGGGIALHGDMVFVPDQPWKAAWLGVDGSVPRAVPMDALVAVADEVLPGAVLQRLLLAGALLLGGLGISRLAGGFAGVARAAAVVVYLWNPWVHQRLEIGQWATVLGYGLLPWVVLAAVRVRDGVGGGWPRLALVLVASAACAPSVGLVGTGVALVVVLIGPARRPGWGVLGIGALANLPWLVPALLGPSLRGNDIGFEAFAARGESGLGTLASLVSMGGIWKSAVVAPERTEALVVGAAAVLALALLAGFHRYAVPLLGRRTGAALVWVGSIALLLALLPSVGPVARLLGDLSEHVPALAILRDSHRSLAPFGLVLALGAAGLVHRLLAADSAGADDEGGDRAGRALGAALVVLAPVALLPSMAWGLRGDLEPVRYPQEWSVVAALVREDPGPVVVLPWTGSYRGFAWNDRRAVLDPAPRYLPGTVLVDDRVFLRGSVVPGEDPALARVGRALADEEPAARLRELGVRWVLVEKENGVTDVPKGRVRYDGAGLRLVQVVEGKTSAEFPRHSPPGWVVSVADATAASVVVISIWGVLRHKRRISPKTM